MRVAGERMRRTKLVQTEKWVVAVPVEMVVPPEDPSEPFLEAETVALLKAIHQRAIDGDVAWLSQHVKVYAAVGAA